MQMVSQLMSRGNEVAQVREELLQKMLTVDQKMDEGIQDIFAETMMSKVMASLLAPLCGILSASVPPMMLRRFCRLICNWPVV